MDSHGTFPYGWTDSANSDMRRQRPGHRAQQGSETSRRYDAANSLYGSDDGDDWYAQRPSAAPSNYHSHHHLKSTRKRHLPSARASPYAHPRAAAPYHQESYHGQFVDCDRHRSDDYRPAPTEHRQIPTSSVYRSATFEASSRPFQYNISPPLSSQYEAENNSTALREPLPRYEVDAWHNERATRLPYRHASPPHSSVPPHAGHQATSPSPLLTHASEAVPSVPSEVLATADLSLVGQLCAKRNCYRQACSLYGDFCEFHKPSRLCKVPECRKCAKTGGFCIAHGGGRRCQSTGCTKSAKEGGFCIAHGGGKRCRTPGCDKAVSSNGGFCVSHSS